MYQEYTAAALSLNITRLHILYAATLQAYRLDNFMFQHFR